MQFRFMQAFLIRTARNLSNAYALVGLKKVDSCVFILKIYILEIIVL